MKKTIKESILSWEYNSKDASIIYPRIQFLPKSLSKFIPYKISPNIITIIGFLFSIINLIIVYYKSKLEKIDYLIISFLSFLSFLFDSLDGEQGRKWKNDKRDIYVLTQLFDHGFDSITCILNYFITIKLLGIDEFYYKKLVFIAIHFTFLVSTMTYKIKKCMEFGILSNPTESVFLNIFMINFISIFSPNRENINLFVFFLFLLIMINNFKEIYYLLNHTKSYNEIIEILEIICFFLIVAFDNKSNNIFLFSQAFHFISLNLIVNEIYNLDCFIENFVILNLIMISLVFDRYYLYFFSLKI
jgi:hypothetical protein